jgi:hypothetical protein
MADCFSFVIICLATARIVRALVLDNGPGNVFGHFRERIGAHERIVKPGSAAELFNCPWCLSLWVAPVASLLIFDGFATWIVEALAVSFVAGALVVFTHR